MLPSFLGLDSAIRQLPHGLLWLPEGLHLLTSVARATAIIDSKHQSLHMCSCCMLKAPSDSHGVHVSQPDGLIGTTGVKLAGVKRFTTVNRALIPVNDVCAVYHRLIAGAALRQDTEQSIFRRVRFIVIYIRSPITLAEPLTCLLKLQDRALTLLMKSRASEQHLHR